MSAVGSRFRYVAAAGRVTGRYGQECTVLRWHKSKVLVRFDDGVEVLTVNRALRRLPAQAALDVLVDDRGAG